MPQAKQAAWKTYAQNTPVQNRVGDTIHLSGFAQYMKLNGLRTFLGSAVQYDAPLVYGVAPAVTQFVFTAEASDNGITVTEFAGGSLDADANYGLWISNPIGTGQEFYKGPWNYLGNADGTTIGAYTATAPFDVLVGMQFKMRIRYYDENDRVSPEYITSKVTAIT
jgi:hypothetical protein